MNATTVPTKTPSVGELAGVESSKSQGEVDFHKGIALAKIIGLPHLAENSMWGKLPPALLAGAYSAAIAAAELKDPWGYDRISANGFLAQAGISLSGEEAQFVVAMQLFASPEARKAAFRCEGAGGFVPTEEVLEAIFVAEGQDLGNCSIGWRIASAGGMIRREASQKYWQ